MRVRVPSAAPIQINMRYSDFKYYALAVEVEKHTEHEFASNNKFDEEYEVELHCTRCGYNLSRWSSFNNMLRSEKECNYNN